MISIENYKQQVKFKDIMNEPLNASEFCRRWIKDCLPGELDYRLKCFKLIHEVTHIPIPTIKGWWDSRTKEFNDDKVRREIKILLQKEDLLRRMFLTAANIPEVQSEILRIISK